MVFSLHNLSARLIEADRPLSANFHSPPPATSRIKHHPFTALLQAEWNQNIQRAFKVFAESDSPTRTRKEWNTHNSTYVYSILVWYLNEIISWLLSSVTLPISSVTSWRLVITTWGLIVLVLLILIWWLLLRWGYIHWKGWRLQWLRSRHELCCINLARCRGWRRDPLIR